MLTERNIKTIVTINELALQIQLKGIAEVFIQYAGHTNQIDVRIYEGCWEKHREDVDFNHLVNFSGTYYLEDNKNNNLKLIQLGFFLQQIINENRMVNFNEVNFIV